MKASLKLMATPLIVLLSLLLSISTLSISANENTDPNLKKVDKVTQAENEVKEKEAKLKQAQAQADQAMAELNNALKQFDDSATVEKIEAITASAWDKASKAESELAVAKEKLAKLETQAETLEKEYLFKTEALKNVETLLNKVKEAEEADAKVTEAYEKQLKAVEEVKKQQQNFEQAKEKFSEYTALKEKYEEVKVAEAQIKELEVKIQEATKIEQEIEELKVKVEAQEEGAQEKLAAAIKKITDLGASATTFKEQKQQLEQKIVQLGGSSDILEHMMKDVEAIMGGTPEEVQTKLEAAQKEHEQALADVQKYNKLSNSLDGLQAQLEEAEKVAANIEEEEVEQLKAKLDETKNQLSQVQEELRDAEIKLMQAGNTEELLKKLVDISKESNKVDADKDLTQVKQAQKNAIAKLEALNQAKNEHAQAKETLKQLLSQIPPTTNHQKDNSSSITKPETKVITHNPNWQQDLRKHNKETNKTLPNTGHINNHSILLASSLLMLVAYKLYKKED